MDEEMDGESEFMRELIEKVYVAEFGVDRETHTDTRREKKRMLSTPISPQRVRRVQSADTGQRSVFSFSPNIIHPTDMPKTPEQSQTARQATETNPQCWILKCCTPHLIA